MKLRYKDGEFTRDGLFFSVIVEDGNRAPYEFYGKLGAFKGQLKTGSKGDPLAILDRKIQYTIEHDDILDILPLSQRDVEYILWCAYRRVDTKNKYIADIVDELSYRLYY